MGNVCLYLSVSMFGINAYADTLPSPSGSAFEPSCYVIYIITFRFNLSEIF